MRFLPAAVLLLAGCAAVDPVSLDQSARADAVLLGEQHDDLDHRALQAQWVTWLAARGALAALALEMAEQGRSTAGLPPAATESEVRAALNWNAQAWPWERYRPQVMAAVRAGVPVLGANLPRALQRHAMQDTSLDRLLAPPALQAQQQAIRTGHCGLLPDSQIVPMTRIQVARDQAMARTIAGAVQPGRTVVLLAGAGHVDPELGIPVHLPATLAVQPVVLPLKPPPPGGGRDFCAELRRQLAPAGAPLPQ